MTSTTKGTTVLVTGFTGFVGAHVADQALKAGYNVRGTSRTAAKGSFLLEKFTREYGEGRFEVAEVADMTAPGAFDEALQGVSAVIHVAAIINESTDPEEVLVPSLQGIHSILRSAAKTPSVKRFVLTSSAVAADWPNPGVKYELNEDSWNEVSAEGYKTSEGLARAFHLYAQSKVEVEKAAWKFVEDEKPRFTLNTTIPATNFGPSLDPSSTSSMTPKFPLSILSGRAAGFQGIPPQWFVDVRDTARLHIAALTSAPGTRIWAVASPWHWNEVLRIVRSLRPDRTDLPESFPWGDVRDLSKIDNKRGTALLKEMGRDEWIGLEESLAANIKGF